MQKNRGVRLVTRKRQPRRKNGNKSIWTGDVKVSLPLRTGRRTTLGAPRFSMPGSGDGRITVQHREVFSLVTDSTTFTATSFSINPGLSTMFPWLSSIAINYEKYVFRKLQFRYQHSCASTNPGLVLLSVDFDPSDATPTSEFAMESFHRTKTVDEWSDMTYVCDGPDLKRGVTSEKFIRTGALAANQDITLRDVGNLISAVSLGAGTATIGRLWVDYVVDLITPQVDPAAIALASSARITSTTSTRAAPFDTAAVLGGLDVIASAATVTFNRVGQYLLTYNFTGTASTDVLPTITGTAAVVANVANNMHIVAVTNGMASYTVNITAVGQTMIFDFTASCTTMTSMKVRIAPYATSLA